MLGEYLDFLANRLLTLAEILLVWTFIGIIYVLLPSILLTAYFQ